MRGRRAPDARAHRASLRFHAHALARPSAPPISDRTQLLAGERVARLARAPILTDCGGFRVSWRSARPLIRCRSTSGALFLDAGIFNVRQYFGPAAAITSCSWWRHACFTRPGHEAAPLERHWSSCGRAAEPARLGHASDPEEHLSVARAPRRGEPCSHAKGSCTTITRRRSDARLR